MTQEGKSREGVDRRGGKAARRREEGDGERARARRVREEAGRLLSQRRWRKKDDERPPLREDGGTSQVVGVPTSRAPRRSAWRATENAERKLDPCVPSCVRTCVRGRNSLLSLSLSLSLWRSRVSISRTLVLRSAPLRAATQTHNVRARLVPRRSPLTAPLSPPFLPSASVVLARSPSALHRLAGCATALAASTRASCSHHRRRRRRWWRIVRGGRGPLRVCRSSSSSLQLR